MFKAYFLPSKSSSVVPSEASLLSSSGLQNRQNLDNLKGSPSSLSSLSCFSISMNMSSVTRMYSPQTSNLLKFTISLIITWTNYLWRWHRRIILCQFSLYCILSLHMHGNSRSRNGSGPTLSISNFLLFLRYLLSLSAMAI